MTNLTDDVVERSARAICGRELDQFDCARACLAANKCVGRLSECVIADARAALEAARYGEIVEGLKRIAEVGIKTELCEWEMSNIARALLSSIGTQP